MNHDPLAPLAGDPPQRVRLELAPPGDISLPHVPRLLAGAAEVDITPPPGMPKAGHSSNAHSGTGFRTRLHAHVLHLRAGTTSLAIVQCDLLAGSSIVAQLVARAVAADTDVRLPGLFLGATHTHAGPGQFHGSEAMNRFASNHSGFDPAWTSWLVERIAGAVREAVSTRRPARLAAGAIEIWGLTRNRSVESWVRNDNVAGKPLSRRRRTLPSPREALPPQLKYEAVNPWLHLIRVDAEAADGGHEPLAAATIFSIHGTGISQRDHAFNADVWAYLKGELRAHIVRSAGRDAVVGAMEGTHGDVAPAVRPGMLVYPEAERVGRGIGAAAAELYDRLEASLSQEVDLAAGLRELDLGTGPEIEGITLPAPAFGAATMAGARENNTAVIHRIPPFRPGTPKPRGRGPHGAKWIPGGRRLHDLIVPAASFPSVLPVQALRIAGTLIVGLPFEITVESGRRIEAAVRVAVRVAVGPDIERIAVSSLANEQFCYLTTPEEYSLQRYEGGNTLYGPRSQPFVTAYAARLAGDVLRHGRVADQLPSRRFDFAAHRYLAMDDGRGEAPSADGEIEYTDQTATEDGYWQFAWHDRSPGGLCWHEPIARVEARGGDGGWVPALDGGRALDDQGYHVGVFHLGADGDGRHRYGARWYTRYLGPDRPHRIVVRGGDGREMPSDPFA